MNCRVIRGIVALCVFGCCPLARAAIDYRVPFNMASTIDGRSNDGGGRNAGIGPIPGAAELSVSRNSSSNLPGHVEGFARADYGVLKAFIQTSGSITDHSASALSNEWFTISDPNVLPGSIGTLYLSYVLSGAATVHDIDGGGVPGDWVFGSLAVIRDRADSNPLGTELGRLSRGLANGGAVGPGQGPSNRLTVTTDFLYGTPFNITTVLSASVISDAQFTFLANGNLVKLGGVIDFLEADFANSAVLNEAFIPMGATLSAASGTNYAAVIRFGAPVPLPPALGLLACALATIFSLRLKPGIKIEYRRHQFAERQGICKTSGVSGGAGENLNRRLCF